MRHWVTRILLVGLLFTTPALAQTAAPSFEVVSIKPTPPAQLNRLRTDFCQQSGRFTMLGAPVIRSIRFAYQVADYEIAGAPDWAREFATAYNIEAITAGPVTVDQCRLMVQSLFAERFKLKTHREQRESRVYLLTVVKTRLRLREGGEVRLNGGTQVGNGGKPQWPDGLTMPELARILSGYADRPVIDRTGLQGRYGIKLDFSLNDGDDRPTIFTAVQEQLGLKLEPGRAPIEMLIVDHIEKPAPNE
jgi:uncharacterized protein (TIGR03435 family)